MTKPESIQFEFENIPRELRALPQWVCFQFDWSGTKYSKVPYTPGSRARASTTDATTWRTFDQAVSDYSTNARAKGDCQRAGIGFVFSPDDPYCGVDLDGCARDDTFTEFALEVMTAIGSYTELSVSGRGLHIIVCANVARGVKTDRIEIYGKKRYFTFTGRVVPGHSEICQNQAEITRLVEQITEQRDRVLPPGKSFARATVGCNESVQKELNEALEAVRKNPTVFALFRKKSYLPYKSESERDMALCGRLIRLLGPNAALIDQVFRHSEAMRDKWDHCRGSSTWGAETIRKAIRNRDWMPAGDVIVPSHIFEAWRVPGIGAKGAAILQLVWSMTTRVNVSEALISHSYIAGAMGRRATDGVGDTCRHLTELGVLRATKQKKGVTSVQFLSVDTECLQKLYGEVSYESTTKARVLPLRAAAKLAICTEIDLEQPIAA